MGASVGASMESGTQREKNRRYCSSSPRSRNHQLHLANPVFLYDVSQLDRTKSPNCKARHARLFGPPAAPTSARTPCHRCNNACVLHNPSANYTCRKLGKLLLPRIRTLCTTLSISIGVNISRYVGKLCFFYYNYILTYTSANGPVRSVPYMCMFFFIRWQ
jgi:hypothetical protein